MVRYGRSLLSVKGFISECCCWMKPLRLLCDLCAAALPLPGHGFVGYSSWLLGTNSMPDYSPGENFFTVFGVFFPAATGEPHPGVGLSTTVVTANAFKHLPTCSYRFHFVVHCKCCIHTRCVCLCVQGSWQASTWAQTSSGLNITSLWEHWQLSLLRMTTPHTTQKKYERM